MVISCVYIYVINGDMELAIKLPLCLAKITLNVYGHLFVKHSMYKYTIKTRR